MKLKAAQFYFLLVLFCFAQTGLAQDKSEADSLLLISLDTTYIKTAFVQTSSATIEDLDLSFQNKLKADSPLQSLESAGWTIKQSGAGGLATPSINGLGAEYHQIEWNDLQLNSVMNGYLDLNVIPKLLSHQSHTHQDVVSSNAGAVIEQSIRHSLENIAGLKSGIGSFGERNVSAFYWLGDADRFLVADLHYRSANNDFIVPSLLGPNNETKKQEHAYFRNSGISLHAGTRLNRFTLKSGCWFSSAKRELPAPLSSASHLGEQTDQHIRAFLNVMAHNRSWSISTGIQMEKIHYVLDRIQVDDINRGNSWQIKFKRSFQLSKDFSLLLKAKNNFQWAKVDAYEEIGQQNLAELTTKIEYYLPAVTATISSSVVNVDAKTFLLLPQLALDKVITFDASKFLLLHFLIKRHFRNPTLNDLNWEPGGNPHLQAETGWSSLFLIQYKNKSNLSLRFSPFANLINNKILWLPVNAFWTATNSAKIRSWGATIAAKKILPIAYYHRATFAFSYQYNHSTNREELFPGDQSVGKQLIFSPQHRATFSSTYQWKKLSFNWEGQFYGEVFTTRDHGSSLDPYFIMGSNVSYDLFTEKKHTIKLQLAVNNLLNKEYYQVPFQALPGRNLLFTISYNLQK